VTAIREEFLKLMMMMMMMIIQFNSNLLTYLINSAVANYKASTK
jgi:hypothetical protein